MARISRPPPGAPRGPQGSVRNGAGKSVASSRAAATSRPPAAQWASRAACGSLTAPSPASASQARTIEASRPGRPGARIGDQERKDALSELGRAILADLGQPVIDHRIGKAHTDLSPIVCDRQLRQSRCNFFGDHCFDEVGQLWITDRLPHQLDGPARGPDRPAPNGRHSAHAA